MSTSLKKYFPAGTPVKWSASAENYITESGELILNDDTTLTIKLKSSRILFSWDGGGTKTVYFRGNKEVTSTSPIYLGDDGFITDINDKAFQNDSTTKNVFLDVEGFPSEELPYKESSLYGIFSNDTNTIENIEIINSSHITNFKFVFANMKHIKTISVDTSGATMMEGMFAKSAIVNAPVLETSNITSTKFMFFDCSNLEHIPLYDFSNVTNMYGTFGGCTNLTSIPQLDTHNVTDMHYCFQNCTNLTTIPQINTSNVTDMYCCFQNCTSLTTIPQLDTSNVTDVDSCFSRCTKLKSIPLLDFSKVEEEGVMVDFYQCTSLTDVGGFTGLKVNIDFKYSPLTHASALNVINNIPVSRGHSIIFKKTTFDTLTPEEISIATNKGWTIYSNSSIN